MKIKDTFGVDAGNISVIDIEFVNKNGGIFNEGENKVVELEAGTYEVTYRIPDSWNGEVKGKGIVRTSGKVVLGDACYNWSDVEHEVWHNFLDLTDHLSEFGSRGFAINTGGDGSFETIFEFKKIDDISVDDQEQKILELKKEIRSLKSELALVGIYLPSDFFIESIGKAKEICEKYKRSLG